MPEKMTLTCAAGHTWERAAQRGRPPAWCPEHKPVVVAKPSRVAKPKPPPKPPRVPKAQQPPAQRNAAHIERIDVALATADSELSRKLTYIRARLSREQLEDGDHASVIDTLHILLPKRRAV